MHTENIKFALVSLGESIAAYSKFHRGDTWSLKYLLVSGFVG